MDAFAAIVTVDPPSLVAWLVVAFAASLYPVGLFFSGCPCCPQGCGELPYVRCRRDECLTCTPQDGTSRRIRSISGAIDFGTGAELVCSRNRLPLTISATAFHYLSAGEVLQISHRYTNFQSPARTLPVRLEGSADPQVPGNIQIAVVGADKALLVSSLPEIFISTNAQATRIVEFGDSSKTRSSVSAAISAHVRAVKIINNGALLDPATVSEASLLSMLTLGPVTHDGGDSFRTTATLTPSPAMFQYYPPSADTAKLEYTIEFRRGSASVFRAQVVNIRKISGQPQTPLPEGGIDPVSLPTYTFTDTQPSDPPSIVNGTSITVYSDRTQPTLAVYTSEPSGQELLGIQWETTSSQYVENISQSISQGYSCESERYIFNPRASYSTTGSYNFDFDQVDEFIRGERCLQYQYNGQTYERCIEPSNVLCEKSLCDAPWLFPQYATVAATGPCGISYSLPAKLSGCDYWAGFRSCSLDTVTWRVSASRFYQTSDLLYAIENGPRSSTIAVSQDDVNPPGTASFENQNAIPPKFSNMSMTIGAGGAGQGPGFVLACSDGFTAHHSGVCFGDSITISAQVSVGALISASPDNQDQIDAARDLAEELAGLLSKQVTAARTNQQCDYRTWGSSEGSEPFPSSGGSALLWEYTALVDECGAVSQGGLASGVLRKQLDVPGVGADEYEARISPLGNTISVYTPGSFFLADFALTKSFTSDDFLASTAQRIYSQATITPSEFDWRGGQYSVSATAHGLPPKTINATQGARLDGIRQNAGLSPIVFGGLPVPFQDLFHPPAIATATQTFRPCAILSVSARWPGVPLSTSTSRSVASSGAVGLLEVVFESEVPCDQEFSATASADWITVRLNTDLRTFCVDIAPNYTGQQRSGTIAISPVWLFNGLPSSSTSAAIGTFNYAITQSA